MPAASRSGAAPGRRAVANTLQPRPARCAHSACPMPPAVHPVTSTTGLGLGAAMAVARRGRRGARRCSSPGSGRARARARVRFGRRAARLEARARGLRNGVIDLSAVRRRRVGRGRPRAGAVRDGGGSTPRAGPCARSNPFLNLPRPRSGAAPAAAPAWTAAFAVVTHPSAAPALPRAFRRAPRPRPHTPTADCVRPQPSSCTAAREPAPRPARPSKPRQAP
jgi:hypothetical protein